MYVGTAQTLDITTWPSDLSASQLLEVYQEIMNSDPEAKSILNDVNIKLKNHGVENLRQIFKYCDGQPKADGASAFFSQNVKIVETRISIPVLSQNPWSESATATINDSSRRPIFI